MDVSDLEVLEDNNRNIWMDTANYSLVGGEGTTSGRFPPPRVSFSDTRRHNYEIKHLFRIVGKLVISTVFNVESLAECFSVSYSFQFNFFF